MLMYFTVITTLNEIRRGAGAGMMFGAQKPPNNMTVDLKILLRYIEYSEYCS